MSAEASDAITREDVDEMLLREWEQARIDRLREEMNRLSLRAVDKVHNEFALRGFAGFTVRMGPSGYLIIEGIAR